MFSKNIELVLFLGDILPHDIKLMTDYGHNDEMITKFFGRLDFYRTK